MAETSFKSSLAGSEIAEQQQESCPTCLPSTSPRISNVAHWRPKKQSFCHTYPLQKPALRIHWLIPKQPNSSRNRAQHAFPAQRPESLTAAYWRPNKKQNICHAYPLPMAETSFKNPLAGSETPEQQQESCPTCLPSTAPRISNSSVLTPLTKNKTSATPTHYPWQKPALRVHWLVPKQPNSSRIRAQRAFPAQRPESLTLRTDALKKTNRLPHLPIAETSFESPLAGSGTAEQQQDSCPTCLPSTAPRISNVAYWRPKKNKPSTTPTHCRNQLWESIGWFRNSRTAAGIVPNMPSQHSAPNL